jgi:hypothetical protein
MYLDYPFFEDFKSEKTKEEAAKATGKAWP